MTTAPGADISRATKSDLKIGQESTKDGLHATVAESASTEAEHAKQASLWRHIVGVVWDSLEGEPEYRHYVQRLDRIFLYVGLRMLERYISL